MKVKTNNTKYDKGTCPRCGKPSKHFTQVLPRRDLRCSECADCGCLVVEVGPDKTVPNG